MCIAHLKSDGVRCVPTFRESGNTVIMKLLGSKVNGSGDGIKFTRWKHHAVGRGQGLLVFTDVTTLHSRPANLFV